MSPSTPATPFSLGPGRVGPLSAILYLDSSRLDSLTQATPLMQVYRDPACPLTTIWINHHAIPVDYNLLLISYGLIRAYILFLMHYGLICAHIMMNYGLRISPHIFFNPLLMNYGHLRAHILLLRRITITSTSGRSQCIGFGGWLN